MSSKVILCDWRGEPNDCSEPAVGWLERAGLREIPVCQAHSEGKELKPLAPYAAALATWQICLFETDEVIDGRCEFVPFDEFDDGVVLCEAPATGVYFNHDGELRYRCDKHSHPSHKMKALPRVKAIRATCSREGVEPLVLEARSPEMLRTLVVQSRILTEIDEAMRVAAEIERVWSQQC